MPQNEVAPSQDPGSLIESVITKGDLARLSPQERTQYYVRTCESLGLNPFTKPFEYITLNGQLRLYARREACDQLRKINGISVEIVSRKIDGDVFEAHARAHDKTGRTDEDFGDVSIAGLKGEARANAIMKAVTKAKRRVTLSICGLGFLDETEVDDIPVKDKAIPAVSAAADLDQFAGMPLPEAVTEDTVADMIHNRRSAIWDDTDYRVAKPQPLLDGSTDWDRWATAFEYLITEATSEEINKLWNDNKDMLKMLQKSNRADRYRDITIAGAARRDELHREERDQ